MTPPRIVTSNKGLPRIVDPFGTGEPYYVIVGRGPAAICNHATLRKSKTKTKKDLIGGYRVLHIGFPDSWNEYVDHDMGQAPRLLGLPGYSHPVGHGSPSGRAGRCKSTAFAKSIGDEWKELVKQCGSEMAVVEAVV